MDQRQREQFRDIVVAAMDVKAWSAAELSRASRVSETTITKVMRAQNVAPKTVGDLRRALGIEALATAQAAEGYPMVIEVVRDAIGMWLRDVPEDQLAGKVAKLFAAIANGGQ